MATLAVAALAYPLTFERSPAASVTLLFLLYVISDRIKFTVRKRPNRDYCDSYTYLY